MAKIIDLPVELLENILLPINPSVLGCTRVCWKFNAIATRVLYRHVHLMDRYLTTGGAKLGAFLRTIIGRPDLGRYVRYLFVSLEYPPCDISPIFATEAASRGLSREIQQAIENGCLGAMTFLLLFYLPALRKLRIFTTSSQHLLSMQIRHFRPLPSGLQSVQSVYLSTPWKWDLVQPFFNLPAVDTITWRTYPGEAIMYHGNPDLSPCPLSVKRIKITSHEPPCSGLDLLIRSSPSLQAFSLCFFMIRKDSPFYPLSMGNALRDCAATTLQHLDLDFYHHPEYPKARTIGPLRDFVYLKHIKASFSSLLDYPSQDSNLAIAHRLSETLPESLVSLVLLVDGDWMCDAPTVIEELVKIRCERLVHLKTLDIWGPIDQAVLDRIRLACVVGGLGFGGPGAVGPETFAWP